MTTRRWTRSSYKKIRALWPDFREAEAGQAGVMLGTFLDQLGAAPQR